LWHHSVFNENEFQGGASAYEKILDYAAKQNAWIGSAKQIYEWWTCREKTTIDWKYNGSLLEITPYPKDEHHFIKIYYPDSKNLCEIKNAGIVRNDQKSCEIKTDILEETECIEISFTHI
jgi:hypothetical protein